MSIWGNVFGHAKSTLIGLITSAAAVAAEVPQGQQHSLATTRRLPIGNPTLQQQRLQQYRRLWERFPKTRQQRYQNQPKKPQPQ